MPHLTNLSIPNGFSIFEQDLNEITEKLHDQWPALFGSHIFLTGGTGFFGIWLIESILWANQKIGSDIHLTVLTRSKDDFLNLKAPHLKSHKNIDFIEGSVSNFKVPHPSTHQSFKYILHAASENNVARSRDWAKKHVNSAIVGTQRLLEMAKLHHSKSFLTITSGAVYLPIDQISKDGRFVEGPSGLDDYNSERIVYGQSKRMMEIITSIAANNASFDALIARCFAFLGPHLPLESNYAAGNFLRDALLNRPIVLNGDGTPLRSYLYPVDLVVWLFKILIHGKSGVPYNVGGEDTISIKNLARLISNIAGSDAGVEVRGTSVPGIPPSTYLPSLDRIKSELKVDVSVDLEEGIFRTLQWHRVRT